MPLAGFQSVHIPGNDFHILRPYLSSLPCIHLYKGVMFHCIMKRKHLQSGGGFCLAERERRWGEEVLALPDIGRGGHQNLLWRVVSCRQSCRRAVPSVSGPRPIFFGCPGTPKGNGTTVMPSRFEEYLLLKICNPKGRSAFLAGQ